MTYRLPLTETEWRDFQGLVEADPANRNATRCPFCGTRHRVNQTYPFCTLAWEAKMWAALRREPIPDRLLAECWGDGS